MSATLFQIKNVGRTFGGPNSGWLPEGAAAPPIEHAILDLQIAESDEGYFLISESNNPKIRGGDSWHKSSTSWVLGGIVLELDGDSAAKA